MSDGGRFADARTAVVFAVHDAVSSTTDVTGLVAGPASEKLVKAIVEKLLLPRLRRSLRLLGQEER